MYIKHTQSNLQIKNFPGIYERLINSNLFYSGKNLINSSLSYLLKDEVEGCSYPDNSYTSANLREKKK